MERQIQDNDALDGDHFAEKLQEVPLCSFLCDCLHGVVRRSLALWLPTRMVSLVNLLLSKLMAHLQTTHTKITQLQRVSLSDVSL